jgi:hypothetical protein
MQLLRPKLWKRAMDSVKWLDGEPQQIKKLRTL